jgi:hypothetical protein
VIPYYEKNGIVIYRGNADEVIRTLRRGSVGTLLMDPPYTPSPERVKQFLPWVKDGGKILVLAGILLLGDDLPFRVPHMVGMRTESVRLAETPVGTELGHPVVRQFTAMKLLLTLADGPILDPYMGIGTTLLAAKALGLEAVGIELEEKYCRSAVARLEAA